MGDRKGTIMQLKNEAQLHVREGSIARPGFAGNGLRQEPFWSEHVASYFRWENGVFGGALPVETERSLERGISVVICTYERAGSWVRLMESFSVQDRKADQFIIVDASADGATESLLRGFLGEHELAEVVHYFRVTGPLKGLTRQRNFGLRWVDRDLVGYFDDDVELLPGCLKEMERVHRLTGTGVVGVGAYIENGYQAPTLLWRMRRCLGIVPNLRPGAYHRSGMSVPWSFLPPTNEAVEGEWLIGCSMMWKTAVAREVGFCNFFDGYAQGEDLEFSLRMKRRGKLVVAGAARLRHFHEASGRPDFYKLGYMAIYNRYFLHRSGLQNRTWGDVAWFVYAWTLDTILMSRRLVRVRWMRQTFLEWAGRARAAADLVRQSFAKRASSR